AAHQREAEGARLGRDALLGFRHGRRCSTPLAWAGASRLQGSLARSRYLCAGLQAGPLPDCMFTIIGLVVVFAAVLGGFAMGGGPFSVLIQPSELVVIGGAAIGTLVAAAPGKMRSRLLGTITSAFGGSLPTKDDYLELLKLEYEVFQFMRKNGAVALDEHVN